MGRRTLNRKDLRAANDAAERRKTEEVEETDEDEEEGDDEDEDEDEETAEADGEDDAEADDDAEDEEEGDDDEDAPKKKKKKKVVAKVKAKPKAKAKPRTRTAKVVRMRVVWGVFSNSNQCVATYAYPKRVEAEAHAAKLTGDKKQTHFVQPVKEPIVEEK